MKNALARACAGTVALVLSSWEASSAPLIVDLATDPDPVRIQAENILDSLGNAAEVCDFNADGIEDLIVGAPRADGPSNSRTGAGEAYVIFGERRAWRGPLQLMDVQDIWIYGIDVNDLTGEGVACGDLDGDGWNDLAVAAAFADGPGNVRLQAGDVYLLFGGPGFPAEIDLSVNPGTRVYGDVNSGRLGEKSGIGIGDVNGDGSNDLLVAAYRAVAKQTSIDRAGRAYVVFGTSTWPAEIDLRTASNVMIYGPHFGAGLGMTVNTVDTDRDGRLDLVLGAAGSNGPNPPRLSAGESLVFFGRISWPAQIDLAVSTADARLVGPNAGDGLSAEEQASVGDADGDGTPELWLGADLGDGRAETVIDSGEVLAVELDTTPPPILDLRTTRDAVLYGQDPSDIAGAAVQLGDVNGDSVDDVLFNSAGDGPGNTRLDAGEIAGYFGPISFPADRDQTSSDLLVYGPGEGTGLALRAVVDLNDDGLDEILGIMHFSSGTIPPSLWLISPFDIDGDGITQLPDNCPLVYNPDQTDANSDLRGDACELDWDGDGAIDSDDCAVRDRTAGRPTAIAGVTLTHNRSTGESELTWPLQPTAERYDVSRGLLNQLGSSDYGTCQNSQDPDLSDSQFVDDEFPLSGNGYFYLVRGFDQGCGGAGSWGSSSSGLERSNSNLEACP